MRLPLERDIPLAPLTTLGVGGPARFFCRIDEVDRIERVVTWARENEVPTMFIGGGSNLVISDAGFNGLVAQIDLRGIEAAVSAGRVRVTAAAGEPWDAFVGHCVARGWAGIECLSGIPGRVGATPIQNVGAYGQEVAESIETVHAFDTMEGKMVDLDAEACGFQYRDSRFKSGEPGRFVITAVTYRLEVDGPPSLRYAEVTSLFDELGIESPTLPQVRHAVIAIRRRKSMVLDPSDVNTRSVGSFFTNPVVDDAGFEALTERARKQGLIGAEESPPHHRSSAGYKLSAAWLIDRAGFTRGLRRGGTGLSENHCLAIINRDRATAKDIVALATEIRDGVRERFLVTLTPEPLFVGLPPLG